MTVLPSNDYFLKDSHKKIALSCFIDALTNTENIRQLYAQRDLLRDTAKYQAFLILKASQLEFRLEPFLADRIAETTQSLGLGLLGAQLAGVFCLRSDANIWPQLVQSAKELDYGRIAVGNHYAFQLESPKSLPLPDSIIVFAQGESYRVPGGTLHTRLHRYVPTATLRYALEVDVSGWKTTGLGTSKAALAASIDGAAAKTKEIFSAYLTLSDVVTWLSQIKTYQELVGGFPAAASIDQLRPKTPGQTAAAAPIVLKTL